MTSSYLRSSLRVLIAGMLALPGVAAVTAGTAHATSTTVSTTAELRAAIDQFNADTDGVADVIELGNAGPFLIACGTAEQSNVNGDLDIDVADPLTITYAGPGRATIAIDQSGSPCDRERVFDIHGLGDITLEHLVIRDGDMSGIASYFADGGGIRIVSAATVFVTDSIIENNRSGSGFSHTSSSYQSGRPGGGIYSGYGSLTVTDSIVRGNSAGPGGAATSTTAAGSGGGGGGIYSAGGDLTIIGSTFESNAAGNGGTGSAENPPGSGGRGGAIGSGSANIMIEDSVFGGADGLGNSAGDAGVSAVGYSGTLAGSSGGSGGAVYGASGRLTSITGISDISFNHAGDGSDGALSTAARGGAGGGISTSGELELDGVDIHHNVAGAGGAATAAANAGVGGNGGGVSMLSSTATATITNTRIADNTAGAGGSSTGTPGGYAGTGGLGGGMQFGGGVVSLTGSLIEGNRSGVGGDVVDPSSYRGSGGNGGGLYIGNSGLTVPTLSIIDSTIRANEAGSGGVGGAPSAFSSGQGGGLAYSANGGTTTITSSTFSGNTNAIKGGAIHSSGSDLTQITNSTVDANTTTEFGSGGALYLASGDVEFSASTISDNEAGFGSAFTLSSGSIVLDGTIIGGTKANQCSAVLTDGGGNLEQATGAGSCAGIPFGGETLQLGPLQDNGGPTETRLPVATGSLIDAVDAGDCAVAVDQRAVSRPAGVGCDIGAAELRTTVDAVADAAAGVADVLVIDVLANDVLANDTSSDLTLDPASVSVVAAPANGSASIDGLTGAITYTPTGAFGGADSFTYEVCALELSAICDTAVVSTTITRTDTTPNGFTFVDVAGVEPASIQTSNAISVTGINMPTPIGVTGGSYSIDGAAFTSSAGTVGAGASVRVRHTSSGSVSAAVNTTLTVGGVSDTFTSTTREVAVPTTTPTTTPSTLPTAAVPAAATRFVPLAPQRLFDTRDGTGVATSGKIGERETLDIAVAGELAVPDHAVAVVINLTVTEPDAPGFITAFPRGLDVPGASTLNVTEAGQTRPNLATVPLDDDGYMSVFARMSTHLLGDVAGYYEAVDEPVAAGRVVPLAPSRVFDTRESEAAAGPKGFVPAEGSISVQIAGVAGVPSSGVSAVILNVTAAQSAGPNFVAVYPTGAERPTASSLNLGFGETTANLVMVPLGDDGMIDLFTKAGAHLLADVTGYVTDETAMPDTAGLFVPLEPSRLFDTRPGETPPGPKGLVAPGSHVTATVGGVGEIPDTAAAVVINVTATEAPAGYITAWPSGLDRPVASTLNPQGTADTRANAAILPVGVDGGIEFFALKGAHLLADTTGYFLG